ncbi:MAG TPA: hypothetical protein VFH45_01335 [Acidimicrobiales bacterium]|nr:hypothetical protein [Acidimicrobiales bacterium]
MGTALAAFWLGAAVSLATSYVLVSRLERLGERLGLSEGLLGLVAALAADSPEITSAVTAVVHHEHAVGAGVVLGSNVFNLAAILGLAAVAAGRIRLHRRVVALGGAVALWVALVCLVAVLGALTAVAATILALAVLVPYGVVLGIGQDRLKRLPLPTGWSAWLVRAVAEEEVELEEAILPTRGNALDAVVAVVSTVVVVVASVTMERAASELGRQWNLTGIVVGGLILAAVTSLPNAVAGVYLGARGRGAALLSTALNSNTLNVVAGLLLPALFVGLPPPSAGGTLVAAWYGGLTVLTLGVAWAASGLTRRAGALIIVSYCAFVVALVAVGQ